MSLVRGYVCCLREHVLGQWLPSTHSRSLKLGVGKDPVRTGKRLSMPKSGVALPGRRGLWEPIADKYLRGQETTPRRDAKMSICTLLRLITEVRFATYRPEHKPLILSPPASAAATSSTMAPVACTSSPGPPKKSRENRGGHSTENILVTHATGDFGRSIEATLQQMTSSAPKIPSTRPTLDDTTCHQRIVGRN